MDGIPWYSSPLHSSARFSLIQSYAREDPMEPASFAVLTPGRLDAQSGQEKIKRGRIRTWGTDDKPWANHIWPIKACLDFRWFQYPLRVSECAVCHVIPQPAIFGGSYRTLSVSTFYDSILSLYTCFCVFAMCICFLAVNWWLIILCKAWWDFNLPGDCSCVVAKKRWKQSQGSEPCDMFLQWKSPLDSRSSQLLKTAIWCTY